jgi:hypothetical protein
MTFIAFYINYVSMKGGEGEGGGGVSGVGVVMSGWRELSVGDVGW